MAALVEFSMTPLDKGESVGEYVARSLKIVDHSGLPYLLNPMGTVLEGEWPVVMEVVHQCYQRMSQDCARITCSIKVDWRRDRTGRLESKIARVEKIVGKELCLKTKNAAGTERRRSRCLRFTKTGAFWSERTEKKKLSSKAARARRPEKGWQK